MGEINGRKHNIGGFHNWLHLYMEEKAGRLNYLGYLKKTKVSAGEGFFVLSFPGHVIFEPLCPDFKPCMSIEVVLNNLERKQKLILY